MNLHQRNDGAGENSVRTKARMIYFHEEILPEGTKILRKQRMAENLPVTFESWPPKIRVLEELPRGKVEKKSSTFSDFNNLGLVSALLLPGLVISDKYFHFPEPWMSYMRKLQSVKMTSGPLLLFLLPAYLQLASL